VSPSAIKNIVLIASVSVPSLSNGARADCRAENANPKPRSRESADRSL
jgi:hypothetical protein